MDSARIDGCSEYRIYFQIMIPLLLPAIGVMTILLSVVYIIYWQLANISKTFFMAQAQDQYIPFMGVLRAFLFLS